MVCKKNSCKAGDIMKMFDIVLLLGLPASGKSEIRRLMASMSDQELEKDFHIGKTIDMDDFPYVFIMRKIDESLEKINQPRLFYFSDEKPFIDPRDWLTLVHLLNEDYRDLKQKNMFKDELPSHFVMKRIDMAAQKVGIQPRFQKLRKDILNQISKSIEKDAKGLLEEKYKSYPETFEGKTIMIEFARGGSDGSKMPLDFPFGYAHSLAQLDDDILRKAVIFYNWVTPAESRRKNSERANPDDPGSILHHGVPIEVMLKEYGTDDIFWLEKTSEKSNTVTVIKDSKKFLIPLGVFDNGSDRTTFLRSDSDLWDKNKVEEIKQALKSTFDLLFQIQKG